MAAEIISNWCEKSGVLHQGHMGSRRQRSCIDTEARAVTRVEEAWNRGNIASLLLVDAKGTFDHVNRNCLLPKMHKMHKMGDNDDIVRWLALSLTDRRIQSVIDGKCREEVEIKTGIPQGSPVPPILFAIYLCGVFENVERCIEGCMATSFADDCTFKVEAATVPELISRVQQVGENFSDWGSENFLEFDHKKTEAVAFAKMLNIVNGIK